TPDIEPVIKTFFHRWERRLADVSKDRVVRPFEWGLDWIPTNGHHAIDEAGRLERWVDEVMQDTQAFFTPGPNADFTFTEAAADVLRTRGDAGTLRFPSALTTPHAENNIVVGRWFPSKEEVSAGPRPRRGRAVIVLPQWNSDPGG